MTDITMKNLSNLDPSEQEVLIRLQGLNRHEKLTRAQIAEELGISECEVNEIQESALMKFSTEI